MPIESHSFLLSLATSLILAAITALLGRQGLRTLHVAAAATTATALIYAVYQAEQLGRALVFPRSVLMVHLVFANLASLAFLAVIWTGVTRLRDDNTDRRRWHRRAVAAFLTLALCATATGTYMLTVGSKRPPVKEGVSDRI